MWFILRIFQVKGITSSWWNSCEFWWNKRNPHELNTPQSIPIIPTHKIHIAHQFATTKSQIPIPGTATKSKQLALQEWRQKQGGQRQGPSPEPGHSCPWASACPSCCYSHRSTTRWPSPERRKTWPPSPWSHLAPTHWSSWAWRFSSATPPTLVSADSPRCTTIHRHLSVCDLIAQTETEEQCSARLQPSYEFHFEGLSNFSLSV